MNNLKAFAVMTMIGGVGLILAPVVVFGIVYLDAYIHTPASSPVTIFVNKKRKYKPGQTWVYRGKTYVKRFCRLTVWTIWRDSKGIETRLLSIQGINSASAGKLPRWVSRLYKRRVPALRPGKYKVRTVLQYDCGVAKPYYLDTNSLTVRILPVKQ